jgi:hypothetical protein
VRHGRRGGALRLAAVEGGLMEVGISARTLDYLGLLVAASIVALCSALVTAICIRFEERGACVVLGSIVLWFCTSRRVLLVEVTVKSGMAELEQALEALEVTRTK